MKIGDKIGRLTVTEIRGKRYVGTCDCGTPGVIRGIPKSRDNEAMCALCRKRRNSQMSARRLNVRNALERVRE